MSDNKQEKYGVDKDMWDYFYKRNMQLYQCLANGMKFSEASDLFGLTRNSIKTMWKKQRHMHPEYYNKPKLSGSALGKPQY